MGEALTVGHPVPETFGAACVYDEEGTQILLRSFWKDQPAVLIFLRHFACPCMSAQMTELAPRIPEIHTLGLRVALVGIGETRFIKGFKERFGLFGKPLTVVTDSDGMSFRAAGLTRSVWMSYGPRGLWDALIAIANGHVTSLGRKGDPLQHGGTVAVDTTGNVIRYHRNPRKGSHLPSVEIVDTAMQLHLSRAPLPF